MIEKTEKLNKSYFNSKKVESEINEDKVSGNYKLSKNDKSSAISSSQNKVYNNGFRQVTNLLEKIINPVLNDQNKYLRRIIFDWHRVVGNDLSTKCGPVNIISYRENKQQKNKLKIEAYSGGIALEITYKKETVIEAIAILLGFRLIHELEITQVYKNSSELLNLEYYKKAPEHPLVTQITESFEDEELKEALSNLGNRVFNNK
ncbi:MAG: DUF721 domain-containing protein [Sphingobacteriia bacterium]|nr:DUF721 domain-containing protein [Sphingobacteriia bacterium]